MTTIHAYTAFQAIVVVLKKRIVAAKHEKKKGTRPFCRKLDAGRPEQRGGALSNGHLDWKVSEAEAQIPWIGTNLKEIADSARSNVLVISPAVGQIAKTLLRAYVDN